MRNASDLSSHNLLTNSELLLNNSRTRSDLFRFEHTLNNENTFDRIFRHCTEEIPPKAGLFCNRLHVFVTSFKCQKDITPSNAITDFTFDHFSVVNNVKAAHTFFLSFFVSILSRSNFDHHLRCGGWLNFPNCDFVVSYNTIFIIGYIGEVRSNFTCMYVHANINY